MKAKLIKWGTEGERLLFACPGCVESHHAIPVDGSRGWQWNGDTERPTLTPSVLTTSTRGEAREKHICHLFVTNGFIQFLSDCTHALAGQTVEMEELEDGIYESG